MIALEEGLKDERDEQGELKYLPIKQWPPFKHIIFQ
jgi:hypothetical protein